MTMSPTDDLDFGDEPNVAPTNPIAATRPYHPLNVSSDSFWKKDSPERELVFAELRRTAPVSWQPPIESAVVPDPDDPGFWAVVRYQDVVEVSQRNDVFVSSYGVMFDMLPPMFLEMVMSFLAMDNPQHDKIRKIVSSAFTPKQIARIDADIAEKARRIVAAAAAQPEVDFVASIARHLPIEMYGDMFGIPAQIRDELAHNADDIVAWADPDLLGDRDPAETQILAALRVHELVEDLVRQRREDPQDDLISMMCQAEVDGQRLTDFEVCAFLGLTSVAATDTTRHTATFAARALTLNPQQRAWLAADFEGRIGTAIEEFLRYASVVLNFRRTAVSEYQLGGVRILPGDKVVMMYGAANWDEEVFTDPDRFDLSRSPNPHLAFGGGGVHFCLGNQLAKSMLRHLFRELFRQIPDFEAGDPQLMGTNFMRAVKSMPFRPNPKG